MSWKKHFKAPPKNVSPIGSAKSGWSAKSKNYQSLLPDIYVGHPNRLERYNQYEQMDMDSEINAALDVLAEFSTQEGPENGTIFKIEFIDTPTLNETEIISEQLRQWVSLNEFEQRGFRLFRNTLKYGDQVFIRDPETFKLYWVPMEDVIKVIVNESDGKKPEQYVIKNIAPNLQSLAATQKAVSDLYVSPQIAGANTPYQQPTVQGASGGRFMLQQNETAVDAEHVVHISLSEGLDMTWPFGTSVLEQVFKVYKQKELLEDAIIIYRIQRAPERRVFSIDVGDMNPVMAMQFVERVKNEIHQRRIPSQSGDGASTLMDATYNPLSQGEDYFFPVTADGRGSKVDTLPGGCLSLDTKIPLLDGRELSILEIEEELKTKELWTYSCDPITGEIVPGLISWAGKTQTDAEVLKLTFDNGESLICTPDHKFPIKGKGFVRADELSVNQSMIPFYKQHKQIAPHKKADYEQVYDPYSMTWKYTHRMVAEYMRDVAGTANTFIYNTEYVDAVLDTVHHLDFNRYNNDPNNLAWMNFKEQFGHKIKEGQKKSKAKNPEKWKNRALAITNSNLNAWANPLHYEKVFDAQRIKYTNEMLVVATEVYDQYNCRTKKEFVNILSNSDKFMQLYKEHNATVHTNTKIDKFDVRHLTALLAEFGYNWEMFKVSRRNIRHDDWLSKVINIAKTSNTENETLELLGICRDTFVKKLHAHDIDNYRMLCAYSEYKNHRIVAIERLDTKMDVGTLTIDVDEKYHDYHTFALSCGVFTKNSNLGEIDDLRFFDNKMARGLRIPSSYLPTGSDESERSWNDGRTGTALIQEWRFNQYCKRLQRLIIRQLDKEFKMFMAFRGINIDSSMFKITFNEPQNFAAYAQADVDSTRIQTFSSLESLPYISKRFAMKRYLGMSEEEMAENAKLWAEENGRSADSDVKSAMRGAGISPGDINSDLETFDELEAAEGPGGELDIGEPDIDMGGVEAPATPNAPPPAPGMPA